MRNSRRLMRFKDRAGQLIAKARATGVRLRRSMQVVAGLSAHRNKSVPDVLRPTLANRLAPRGRYAQVQRKEERMKRFLTAMALALVTGSALAQAGKTEVLWLRPSAVRNNTPGGKTIMI